jgi:hypothetical protein
MELLELLTQEAVEVEAHLQAFQTSQEKLEVQVSLFLDTHLVTQLPLALA